MAIPQNAIGKPSTGIKISTGWTLQLVPGSSEIFVDILSYGGEGCRALYRATLGTQSSDTMAYYGVVLMHENLN